MWYEGPAMLDPALFHFGRTRPDPSRSRAHAAKPAGARSSDDVTRDDEDDDDEGPRPSATAVVTRFLPFLRPIPRLVPTV